ncbi:hypothetical protein ACWEFJ_24260 [Actinosynnema sp. NPDC004786]
MATAWPCGGALLHIAHGDLIRQYQQFDTLRSNEYGTPRAGSTADCRGPRYLIEMVRALVGAWLSEPPVVGATDKTRRSFTEPVGSIVGRW